MSEQKPLVKAQIADDQNSVRVSFPCIPSSSKSANLSVEGLTQLIQELGRVRTAMVSGKPIPPIVGSPAEFTIDTNWFTQFDPLIERTLLAFQHSAFGPVGIVLDRSSADLLQTLLSQQLQNRPQSSTDKPN